MKKMNAADASELAQSSIEKFGFEPEHNFYYFMNNEEPSTANLVMGLGNQKIILANSHGKCTSLFPSGILGPKEEHAKMLLAFCNYCLKEGAQEVTVEVRKSLLEDFNKIIPKSIHIKSLDYEYGWPVISLKNFDTELKGPRYYELRKISSRFFKENKIEICEAMQTDKHVLAKILAEWKKNRKSKDMSYPHEYEMWISTNFEGTDYAKCAFVNGKPCAIFCGWRIPNSNSFYLGVVLHNYKIREMGEILYLECFKNLKSMGFGFCNLGGSDSNLLNFKKKFLPEEIYETVEFTVERR